jgi:molybdenum cofactor biosynthesis enzyme MoaA
MSWELFTSIVDQFPRIARVVLHGVGEPMMVRDLPRMIRYLKDRGSYVLFNTNGTLLTPKRGNELIESGLDELRVSLDAAEPEAFALVRGRDMFAQIVRNLRRFTTLQREQGALKPKVSLWLTGLRETIGQLPAFIRLAQGLEIGEVYLQRLVYFDEGPGAGRGQSSLFERMQESELAAIRGGGGAGCRSRHRLQRLRRDRAETSLKKKGGDQPWSPLPAALDPDVFHRPWPGDPLLRRPLLHAGL